MKGSKRVEVQMHLRDMDMDRKRDVFCRQHIMISDSSLHESLRATTTTDMILSMEQHRAREIYSNGKQLRLGGIAFKINERAIAAQAYQIFIQCERLERIMRHYTTSPALLAQMQI